MTKVVGESEKFVDLGYFQVWRRMRRKSKKDEKVGSDGLLAAQILTLVLIQPPPSSKVYLMPVKTARAAWLRDLVERILQALER